MDGWMDEPTDGMANFKAGWQARWVVTGIYASYSEHMEIGVVISVFFFSISLLLAVMALWQLQLWQQQGGNGSCCSYRLPVPMPVQVPVPVNGRNHVQTHILQ